MVFRQHPLQYLKNTVHRLITFARFVMARYHKDRASSVAASLAYTSLLSLVPLMAIALGMLAAFPVFTPFRTLIENWVFNNFVPTVGEALQTEVSSFIANAGKLSAAGIMGLAVTAVMLLVTIETAFNGIFRVDKARSALSRVLVYWTMMTLGPILVATSVSIQTTLASLPLWQRGQTVLTQVAASMPTLLAIGIFFLMFTAIPNRQVPPRDALTGGLVSGLLFAILRWVFGYYIIKTGAYTTVYGAVAVVPIVLVWMFLSWVVILIGAEITAALAEWRAGYAVLAKGTSSERQLALALEVLSVLHKAAQQGSGGTSRRALLSATTASEAELMGVIRRLNKSGFTAPTTQQKLLLGRDLSQVGLSQLIRSLGLGLGIDDRVAPHAPWRARVLPIISLYHQDMDAALSVSLAEIFQDD